MNTLEIIAKSPEKKCLHLTTAGSHIEYCTSLCVPADLAVGTLQKYISLQISHTMIHFCRSRLCAYKSTHPTSTATFLRTRDCARACFSSAVALGLCHSPFLLSSTFAKAHLCVKYLMIALTHSFLLPLHQTLGFHHRGSLPFSHAG